jgi:tetratricopeptide (TPR) repeat protein
MRIIALHVLLGILVVATAAAADVPAEADSSTAVEIGALPESVATALMLAGARAEAGDLEAALSYYAYALKRAPFSRDLGRRAVTLALQLGRLQDALDAVDLQLDHDPGNLELRVEKGRLLVLGGEVEEAAAVSEELVVEHPAAPEVLALRVQVLERQGNLEEAARIQGRLAALRPEDPGVLLAQAALLLRGGDPAAGEALLRERLATTPEDEAAAQLLVGHLQDMDRQGEAVALLEDLVERTPGEAAHRRGLADLYLAQGREEEACDLLLPLARRGDLDRHARVLLTDLLVRSDRVDEAWELAEGLLEGEEDDPVVLQMVGEIALEQGELDTAVEALQQALARRPENGDLLVSLLLAYSRRWPSLVGGRGAVDVEIQRRWDGLLARADEALEEDSFRQNFILGAMLRRGGRPAEAVIPLSRAATLEPENVPALYDLAWAQEAAGLYEEATGTLDRLLELRPDEAQLLNFYGYLLADRGWQLERAHRMIERAVEAEPENPYYRDSLGWVLHRLGRHEEALEHLITASNQLGDDLTVLEHIGDTLMSLERHAKALDVYRRAKTLGGDPERLDPRIGEAEAALRAAP